MSNFIAVFGFDGTLTTAVWPAYSTADEPENAPVAELARALAAAGVEIVVLSARPESHRPLVEMWLAEHDVKVREAILWPVGVEAVGQQPHMRWKIAHLERLQQEAQVALFADDTLSVKVDRACTRSARSVISRDLNVPTLTPGDAR